MWQQKFRTFTQEKNQFYMNSPYTLSAEQALEQILKLKKRFEKNMHRHKELEFTQIQAKLEANVNNLWSLAQMESTGGEPDVVSYHLETKEYIFFDCSPESPSGRRSLCYDEQALNSRKENKPQSSVKKVAAEMGIELLNEEQYKYLQTLGKFDSKTSSWIKTPEAIRALGGALFADYRFEHVFIYHNGAESYYATRGFRCMLKV